MGGGRGEIFVVLLCGCVVEVFYVFYEFPFLGFDVGEFFFAGEIGELEIRDDC